MTLKYFTDEMPCRAGDYNPVEKSAKELAGGVGRHDSQTWIPPVKTPIVHPERKSQEAKGWYPSLFDPWTAGMPRLAMYQHQVFADIHVSRRPAKEPELYDLSRTTLGQQQDLFGEWRTRYPDDVLDSDIPPKVRRELYAGKRALGGERVTMPRNSWHVDTSAKWSTKLLHCAVCGAELPPEGRKYCVSGECARSGSNAIRRANRKRKWPTDERGWYIQSPQQVWRRPRWIHVCRDQWSATRPKTLSGDCRLQLPWAGEPKVWKISMTNVTPENGGLAS